MVRFPRRATPNPTQLRKPNPRSNTLVQYTIFLSNTVTHCRRFRLTQLSRRHEKQNIIGIRNDKGFLGSHPIFESHSVKSVEHPGPNSYHHPPTH